MSKNKTLLAAGKHSRRGFLKGTTAVVGVAALGAPLFIKDARAGAQLNILMWSEYVPDSVREAFKDATGITINYTAIGDNGEIVSKMKASGGKGFDIASPTNMRALQWKDLGLLQPIDFSKIPCHS